MVNGIAILVAIIVLSSCAQIGVSATPTQNLGQELAIPDLIQQAFAKGEITDEQRLLYLAYAIYEPESLPVRFLSNVEWEGTFTAQEIGEAASSPAILCSMSSYVQSEIRRLVKVATICD